MYIEKCVFITFSMTTSSHLASWCYLLATHNTTFQCSLTLQSLYTIGYGKKIIIISLIFPYLPDVLPLPISMCYCTGQQLNTCRCVMATPVVGHYNNNNNNNNIIIIIIIIISFKYTQYKRKKLKREICGSCGWSRLR